MHRVARGFRIKYHYNNTHTDLTKGISEIAGSSVSQHGHTVAASIVSDDSKVKKVRRRVPKDERWAMVESYLIKYRAMNGGKLPTLTETIKEVGGSHYTIRSILQEMEYRSKASQTDRAHEEDALLKEVAAVDKSSAHVAAVLTSRPMGKNLSEQVVNPKTTVDGDDIDLGYLNSKSFVAEEESKTSNLSRTSIAEEVVNPKTTVDGYDVDLDPLNPKSLGAEEESKISISSRTAITEEVINPKKTVDGDDVDLGYSNSESVVSEEECKTSTLSRMSIAEEVVDPKTMVNGDDVDLGYSNFKSLGAEEESKTSISSKTSITEETLFEQVINHKTIEDGDNVDPGYLNPKSFGAEEESKTSSLSRTSIAEETLSEQVVVNLKTTLDGDDVDLGYLNPNSFDAKEESVTLTSSETPITEEDDSSIYMETVRHESKIEQPESVLSLHAESSEHDVKEKSPSEGQLPQKQQHEQPYESDKLATNNSEMQGGNELPKETSMWGNLKSLADGIIKIWRGL